MGDLTLADFRDELRYWLGDDQVVTDARLNRWINWAYRDVSRPTVYRHWELEAQTTITLVSGQEAYPLPSDAFSTIDLYSTTSGWVPKLAQTSVRELDKRRTSSATGRPTQYAVWGRQVLLWPVPGSSEAGATLQMRYWKMPSPLSSDTDTTVIAADWDPVIVARAAWIGWQAIGVPERAEFARETFLRLALEVGSQQKISAEDPGLRVQMATVKGSPS